MERRKICEFEQMYGLIKSLFRSNNDNLFLYALYTNCFVDINNLYAYVCYQVNIL